LFLLFFCAGVPITAREGKYPRGPRTDGTESHGIVSGQLSKSLPEDGEWVKVQVSASENYGRAGYRPRRRSERVIFLLKIYYKLRYYALYPLARLADVVYAAYLQRRRFYHQRLYLSWRGIVENYTGRKLTLPETDKLVALSGLAAELARLLGGGSDGYAAGLWRGDLPKGLIWEMAGPPGTRLRGGAPSWSWASLDGRTHMPLHYYGPSGWSHPKPEPPFDQAAVLRVAVRRADAGTNPFGHVDGGALTLRSQWFRVQVEAGAEFDAAFRRDEEDTRRGRGAAASSAFHSHHFSLEIGDQVPEGEPYRARYTVGEDGTLVFPRRDWGGALNTYYFECCLDERYDADRLRGGAAARWFVFGLLRIWGRHFLMLQDCGDGSGHYRRIGIARTRKYMEFMPGTPWELKTVTVV
jgi:hypothetical protein